VAVITGGGSGIGAALCRCCAALDMQVVIANIDVAAAERVRVAFEAEDRRFASQRS
jgi:NAD(P)-dependent dehydrogenase (short-subunit alcohol dehydrogenase family)